MKHDLDLALFLSNLFQSILTENLFQVVVNPSLLFLNLLRVSGILIAGKNTTFWTNFVYTLIVRVLKRSFTTK